MSMGCQNRSDDHSTSVNKHYRHDVTSFKTAFDVNGDSDRIMLFKDLELDSKDYDEIVNKLGKPTQEYVDTFECGLNITEAEELALYQIWHEGNHYYSFPDTFKLIPNLLIHKAIWPWDTKKGIVLYFSYDEKGYERPFWGYIREYPPTNIPLWALSEKGHTLSQELELRGLPQKKEEKLMKYGRSIESNLEWIFALKDTPEVLIHMYKWEVDSNCILRLYYRDCEDIMSSKPIWGICCNEDGFYLE